MPIVIGPGEDYTFDVVVRALSPGETDLDFELYLDAGNLLHIERVHYPLTVVESGNATPDWATSQPEIEAANNAADAPNTQSASNTQSEDSPVQTPSESERSDELGTFADSERSSESETDIESNGQQ
jgi:hypothetical protein